MDLNNKYSKQCRDFRSNLQKVDLQLNNLIQYGYILVGQTKTGKTAAAHLISGSVLKGCAYDMVQTVISKYSKARIGNGRDSETIIPNLFEIKLPNNSKINEECYIIDPPGYRDNYNVLRILLNGYSYYRIYSKVQNMKFILCFNIVHIKNTARQFINTIVEFTSSFKNYHDHRHKIWESCAFLFTQVEYETQPQLKNRLYNLIQQLKTQLDPQQQDDIKQFIKFILQQNRIFIIKKYKKGESVSREQLLKQLQQKIPVWWSRELNIFKQIQVDMMPIKFSISNFILLAIIADRKARQQFVNLIDYYNKRIKQIFQFFSTTSKTQFSLTNIINTLVDDTMGRPDSHQFLYVMKKYVDIYSNDYDKQYKLMRQIKQKQLFNFETNSTVSRVSLLNDKNPNYADYVVKKFNVLKKIQQLKMEIKQITKYEQQNIDFLEQLQSALYQIIKQFNNVTTFRNNKFQIIYSYGYIIYRMIKQVKILMLLLNPISKQKYNFFLQQINGKYFYLYQPLRDFMNFRFNYNGQQNFNYSNLLAQYVRNFNFEQKQYYRTIIPNENFIDLITEISFEKNEQIKKVLKLIIIYSDNVIMQNKVLIDLKNQQIQKAIQKLVQARYYCIKLHKSELDQQIRKQYLFMIRKITCNIGQMLKLLKKYELARKVYESIAFVESICQLYKKQIQINFDDLQKNKKMILDLKISYGKYLADRMRQKQAIQVLQSAFELASNYQQSQQVNLPLNKLLLNENSQQKIIKYRAFLLNRTFYEQFDQELERQLCQGKDINKNKYLKII